MKTEAFFLLVILIFVVGFGFWTTTKKTVDDTTTIRSHHRLTPRLELSIDSSGRVDTVFIYKAEGK